MRYVIGLIVIVGCFMVLCTSTPQSSLTLIVGSLSSSLFLFTLSALLCLSLSQALDLYSAAEALSPRLDWEILYAKGLCHVRMGDHVSAVAAFKEANSVHRTDVTYIVRVAWGCRCCLLMLLLVLLLRS